MATGDRDRVILAEVIAKCWQDDAYRQKLLANPKAFLKEVGLDIPNSADVRVLENTDVINYVVLPKDTPLEDFRTLFMAFFEKTLPLGDREIRMVQNNDKVINYVIPTRPAAYGSGKLSEEELASIAGGGSTAANADTGVNAQVAGNVEGVTNGVGAQNVGGATEGVIVAVAAGVLT